MEQYYTLLLIQFGIAAINGLAIKPSHKWFGNVTLIAFTSSLSLALAILVSGVFTTATNMEYAGAVMLTVVIQLFHMLVASNAKQPIL